MYSKQAAEWTLFYADRNDRFQRYLECGPSAHVADLLAEIEADPTCIFWDDPQSTLNDRRDLGATAM